ncbi:MAG: tetratricopeptide repeat protein [Treponema sp.]|jgi:tetratricopeptide (TPR) repeat protein|nr:tetratricopeptide repeat protein [Treponema sp.]
MRNTPLVVLALFYLFSINGCKGMAASAEEYYSIGMAYFELGKYEEAEKWLTRAATAQKTMTASQYNLGRLAFERQRYQEAAERFEDILKKDPNNILALKAAAYTRIRTGDLNIAEKHYTKLLALVPENADDGYNHALVLYAMERYAEAEQVLSKYPLPMLENSDMQLLFARTQNAQNKVEAINSYSAWLNSNSDSKVRYEYARALEHHELYARALEEYRKALSDASEAENDLRNDIRFSIARLLLTADSENHEGITELQNAINEGYKNITAVEELLENKNINETNKDSIRNIIYNMRLAQEPKAEDGDLKTNPESGS